MSGNDTISYYTLEQAAEELELKGLYTLECVHEMISEAITHDRRDRKYKERHNKKEKNRERIYYIKQRLSGLTMVASGIIAFLMGMGMYSIFAVPIGMYLILTNHKIMDI